MYAMAINTRKFIPPEAHTGNVIKLCASGIKRSLLSSDFAHQERKIHGELNSKMISVHDRHKLPYFSIRYEA